MYDRRFIAPITVILLLLLAASVAGCTVSIPGVSQSHVQAFANAWHDNVASGLDLKSWQETPEGSDTIRMHYNVYNGSNSVVPTTTFDLRVKEFKNTNDATTFVNGMNDGYTSMDTSDIASEPGKTDIYTKVMGHGPSKTDGYMIVDSLLPPKARMILQLDEFVIYGSATGVMFSSSSTSPTPLSGASASPYASATPSVSPTPSPSPDYASRLNTVGLGAGLVSASPFEKVTVNGKQAYAGTFIKNGQTYNAQVYPMNSYSETLAFKDQLTSVYKSQGYATYTPGNVGDASLNMWYGRSENTLVSISAMPTSQIDAPVVLVMTATI